VIELDFLSQFENLGGPEPEQVEPEPESPETDPLAEFEPQLAEITLADVLEAGNALAAALASGNSAQSEQATAAWNAILEGVI
jgi:hypothetical protein